MVDLCAQAEGGQVSAIVAPMNKPKPQDRMCSFCGTPESKAKKFVGAGSAHICGECIVKAKRRIDEIDKEASEK